ncbi:O-antigen ligase family protein [Robiginitalea aurantiaca]|uniref:O-antigen ligase family protein n=1 Tax=Robiginitalea aurantiaca TaxID=3056915 RepID=A0ABT7WAH8_9FLAO|nr:O-antigen ligase family protein [Robiginitalea aurantiaca]MDM9629903.1 O-antigen ligase family protein [Robiginitalea aurantiaca]
MNALKLWLLYLVIFTLPMYMKVNNVLLGAFVLVGFLDNLLNRRYKKGNALFLRGLPIIGFFFLALFGAFREFSFEGFSYLEKYWSFLLLPLVMLPDPETFRRHQKDIFLSLVWGCITTLVICYSNVIYDMVVSNEPASYFFRWRHLGHQFTEIADTHPTYLSLFILTSICFLAQEETVSYTFKSIVLPFLIVSLFQLASRAALVILVLLLIFILFQRVRKNKWQIAGVLFGIVFGGLLVFYYGSDYLTTRLFSAGKAFNDRRVEHWEVSYDIFKANPVTGVGYQMVGPLRKEGYIKHGFEIAASEEYNAHNQFLEFLSTQGVIGGFVYGVSLAYLFFLAVVRKDLLFSFVFFAFIMANLTESMMVRIKGIEYFAILGTLFLCSVTSSNQVDEDIHNP